MRLEDIHFHDSRIVRVIEVPERDLLALELEYPVDWDANVFCPRTLLFHDVSGYSVDEGPFAGTPTILEYSTTTDGERTRIVLQTNAGRRSLSYTRIDLVNGHRAV